jgi:hypothetical protein
MPKRRVPRHEVTQPLDKPYRFIPLTQGLNAIVDVEDFDWLSKWNWHADKKRHTFYAARTVAHGESRTTVQMHRLILGESSRKECDHKNRNGLDNRRNNLRKASPTNNRCNMARHRDNRSGFKGVKLVNGRFVAAISVAGVYRYIGCYATPEEAARAYDEAAKKFHGEFAVLNFPAS